MYSKLIEFIFPRKRGERESIQKIQGCGKLSEDQEIREPRKFLRAQELSLRDGSGKRIFPLLTVFSGFLRSCIGRCFS
jgi:hypothetical protein